MCTDFSKTEAKFAIEFHHPTAQFSMFKYWHFRKAFENIILFGTRIRIGIDRQDVFKREKSIKFVKRMQCESLKEK